MPYINENFKIDPVLSYASGTADRTSDIIDTAGYNGAMFVVHFAAIATGATTSVKVHQSAASNMASSTLLKTVSVADDDDNQLFVVEIHKPTQRYLQLTIDKDTSNATAESAVCYMTGARYKPVTQPSDTTVGTA